MNLLSISLTPHAVICLSRAEIDLLMRESDLHYDGYCRAVGKPGRGSFLSGWSAQMEFGGPEGEPCDVIEVRVTQREIDTCCKILEMSRDPLAGRLSWALGQAHRTIGNAYATFEVEDA